MQETTSNTTTIDPIVNALNSYYGTPGKYARSPVQGDAKGGSGNVGFGNGPNAMVYNSQKLTLIASVGVDPPGGTANLGSTSGEYREAMRYEFRPVGGTSADDFYIYVSHYKASSGASNEAARLGEATIIRNDAATLPSTAQLFTPATTTNSPAAKPRTKRSSAPRQINAGIDPVNPTGATGVDWTT